MKSYFENVTKLALMFVCVSAYGQAGTDCGEQSRHAADNCRARLDGARASSVASFDNSSGINGGGGAQAGAAYAISERIGQQIAQCRATDLRVCERQCNQALSTAKDPALAARIKANMQKCVDTIDAVIASGEASQAGLRQVASESNNGAELACVEGQVCGTPDPNLHRVVACGTGYFSYNGGCEPYYFYNGRRNPLAPR